MAKMKSGFNFDIDKDIYIDVTEDVNRFPVYTSCSYGMYKGKTPIRVKQSGHYVENVDEYGNHVSGHGLWLDKTVQVERLNKHGKFVKDDSLQTMFYQECRNRYYNNDDFEYEFYIHGYNNEELNNRYDRLIRRDDNGNRNPIENLSDAILYKDERSETHAYYSNEMRRSTGAYHLRLLDGRRPIKGIEKGFEAFKASHSLEKPSKKNASLKLKDSTHNNIIVHNKDSKSSKGSKGSKKNKENQDLSL